MTQDDHPETDDMQEMVLGELLDQPDEYLNRSNTNCHVPRASKHSNLVIQEDFDDSYISKCEDFDIYLSSELASSATSPRNAKTNLLDITSFKELHTYIKKNKRNLITRQEHRAYRVNMLSRMESYVETEAGCEPNSFRFADKRIKAERFEVVRDLLGAIFDPSMSDIELLCLAYDHSKANQTNRGPTGKSRLFDCAAFSRLDIADKLVHTLKTSRHPQVQDDRLSRLEEKSKLFEALYLSALSEIQEQQRQIEILCIEKGQWMERARVNSRVNESRSE